ncbi:hypothetical protein Bca52824_002551 [Brassica carinata]|uniref:Uncharacterized protein n=1 Tax=Brassica carinata TaxID=52824 RepID=A0A8X7WKW4_BRACI|nr:hypothetical protein Bca52824_002551 [Brassica carinata]
MWGKIVIHKVEDLEYNLDIMCRHAVDRSQGGLVEIDICDFGTDSLEHLDLRQCFNVNFVGDLEKWCSERIKVLRRPNDSTEDYPYGDMALELILTEFDYLFSLMPDISLSDFYSSGSDSSDYGGYDNEPYELYDDF